MIPKLSTLDTSKLSANKIRMNNKVNKANFKLLRYLPFLKTENKSFNLTLSLFNALSIVYIVPAING